MSLKGIIPFTVLHPLPSAPKCSFPSSAILGQPELLLPGTDPSGPNTLENSYSCAKSQQKCLKQWLRARMLGPDPVSNCYLLSNFEQVCALVLYL